MAKKTVKKTKATSKRSTTCKTCGLLRGGPDNHKCACVWSKMTAAERNAEQKRWHAAREQRLVRMKRIDFNLDLSPSNAQELLTSLKPWLEEFHSGSMQLQFGVRDLKSIYVYLRPQQLKKLIARLAEIAR